MNLDACTLPFNAYNEMSTNHPDGIYAQAARTTYAHTLAISSCPWPISDPLVPLLTIYNWFSLASEMAERLTIFECVCVHETSLVATPCRTGVEFVCISNKLSVARMSRQRWGGDGVGKRRMRSLVQHVRFGVDVSAYAGTRLTMPGGYWRFLREFVRQRTLVCV